MNNIESAIKMLEEKGAVIVQRVTEREIKDVSSYYFLIRDNDSAPNDEPYLVCVSKDLSYCGGVYE